MQVRGRDGCARTFIAARAVGVHRGTYITVVSPDAYKHKIIPHRLYFCCVALQLNRSGVRLWQSAGCWRTGFCRTPDSAADAEQMLTTSNSMKKLQSNRRIQANIALLQFAIQTTCCTIIANRKPENPGPAATQPYLYLPVARRMHGAHTAQSWSSIWLLMLGQPRPLRVRTLQRLRKFANLYDGTSASSVRGESVQQQQPLGHALHNQ